MQQTQLITSSCFVLTKQASSILGGGFKYLRFSPRNLWKIPISTNIFQMGWNHRPGYWLEFQTTWNISELDLKQSISFHWENYFCCPYCWEKKIKSSRPGCPKESGSHVQLNVGVATVESLTKLLTLARSQKGLALHLSAHAYRNDKAGTRWIGWMDGEFTWWMVGWWGISGG